MTPVSYHSNPFELILPAVRSLKGNIRPLLLIIIAYIIGGIAFIVGIGALIQAILFNGVNGNLMLIVGAFLLFGLLVMLLMVLPLLRTAISSAKNERITVAAAFAYDAALFFKLLGTCILYGTIVAIGSSLFLIPGFIFTALFLFVPYIALNENTFGIAGLKRSLEIQKGHKIEVLGVFSLLSSFQLIAQIPVVGVLLYAGISVLLIALIPMKYFELKALQENSIQAPEPHKTSLWNYAFIISGIVALFFTSSLHPSTNVLTTFLR